MPRPSLLLEPRFWQLPVIEAGSLAVRLAEDITELHFAQSLRYRVFVEEMGARASDAMHQVKRDWDEFDSPCDHLLVVDRARKEKGKNPVVGTYRLLRGQAGRSFGKFYTQSEYDIERLMALPYEVLELGRSCVHSDYRNRSSMQLLWRGIGAYVEHYGIGLMFGCASFPGTDTDSIRAQLSYLHHFHLAPENIRIRALPERYVEMDRMPKEQIEARKALASLPPLIKGYLRLGGFVGEGAVADYDYNTTDVSILVPTANVTEHYYNRYGAWERGQ
jgi:L-ornithine Nalpha-acyltransferase